MQSFPPICSLFLHLWNISFLAVPQLLLNNHRSMTFIIREKKNYNLDKRRGCHLTWHVICSACWSVVVWTGRIAKEGFQPATDSSVYDSHLPSMSVYVCVRGRMYVLHRHGRVFTDGCWAPGGCLLQYCTLSEQQHGRCGSPAELVSHKITAVGGLLLPQPQKLKPE